MLGAAAGRRLASLCLARALPLLLSQNLSLALAVPHVLQEDAKERKEGKKRRWLESRGGGAESGMLRLMRVSKGRGLKGRPVLLSGRATAGGSHCQGNQLQARAAKAGPQPSGTVDAHSVAPQHTVASSSAAIILSWRLSSA